MERIIPVFHSLSKSLRTIQRKSSGEISIVQSSILYELSLMKSPSMQTVAEAVDMDITTFSRQIRTLEKKELLLKTPFADDRRIFILSLTEQGKSIVELINNEISLEVKKAFTSMSDFEQETVIRSMQMLTRRLKEL
ncbi:MarR family winged helix-turn-helix transcriptional regulator [Sporosarcina sp. G11-34]|uniref:MarR family winged helix-turn-helix transcriptional regulator n=1 Tax=Sporosarcina sp. G11-34 TaxID=2849605 RepID=UPI0022A999D4|nr:MarR family transcriptional regulator [Sporosarcina sp. G11-34]MCZ2258221.1 MarR family transcriptional regulator [Sporosarcina sp. G11-34]